MKNLILLLFTGLLLLLSVDTFAEKYETFPVSDFELCEQDQRFEPTALPDIPIYADANFINNIATIKPVAMPISSLIKRPGWQIEHALEAFNMTRKRLLIKD